MLNIRYNKNLYPFILLNKFEYTGRLTRMRSARCRECIYFQTTVFIRVEFLKIGEIDTLKEKYSADLFIQARWREPLFDHDKDIVSSLKIS